MEKISESGIVDRAGQMRFPMDRLTEFAKAHIGQRLLITIEADMPGSTAMQHAYYYKYILPCVVEARKKQGTRMTEKGADNWLLEQYPADVDYTMVCGNMEARRLTCKDMSDFLDWLKQYAAENLSIYIEDPQTL